MLHVEIGAPKRHVFGFKTMKVAVDRKHLEKDTVYSHEGMFQVRVRLTLTLTLTLSLTLTFTLTLTLTLTLIGAPSTSSTWTPRTATPSTPSPRRPG